MDGDLGVWGALFDARAWNRLRALAALIPDLGDAFGFECRLAAESAGVDFGLSIRRPRAVGSCEAPAVLTAEAVPPAWRRFADLWREWSRPDSDLRTWVPFAFLEFDGDSTPETFAHPSVFLSLDWPTDGTVQGPLDCLRLGLGLLHGGSLPVATRDRLDRCIDALPVDGRVVHVGALLGRGAHAVRLSAAFPRPGLSRYLDRIGCPVAPEVVEALLRALVPTAGRVHLEYDVADTVGSRIGVVLTGGSGAGWRPLLDRLEEVGLCAPAKWAALLAWPGTSGARGGAEGNLPPLARTLSHIKVTHAPGEHTTAKAYLSVTPVAGPA